ncbi:ABC transporter permease [Campylobacter geochelonis]|uniref:ABC transporter permease n=1 Tax=Campylobacter geochelonis TaxID=1780362 RepID=UPI000770965B|nr:ABC transporter permease [Campylobacter geochelonis]CZE49966.1 Ribose transport system permease protein rbsC [Campylobacter geochelonis]
MSRTNLIVSAMLLLILALFTAFSPDVFLSKSIYFSYLSSIPIIIILSLGLLPLIIAGEFDMSFPAVMAMSGFVFSYVFKLSNSLLLAAVLSLSFGAFAGAFNAFLVVNAKVPSIIATIGTQFFWRGLAVVLSGGLSLSLASADGVVKSFFVGRVSGVPAQSLIAIALAVLTYILIFRHKFGDNILFTGDNTKVAKMLGINVAATKYTLFINMGLASALASIILSLEFVNWWPTQGDGYMLLVFAAIFIGGTSVYGGSGSVYGTLVGGVIIGIMESGIVVMGFDAFYTRLVYGAIIVISVVVYAKFEKKQE